MRLEIVLSEDHWWLCRMCANSLSEEETDHLLIKCLDKWLDCLFPQCLSLSLFSCSKPLWLLHSKISVLRRTKHVLYNAYFLVLNCIFMIPMNPLCWIVVDKKRPQSWGSLDASCSRGIQKSSNFDDQISWGNLFICHSMESFLLVVTSLPYLYWINEQERNFQPNNLLRCYCLPLLQYAHIDQFIIIGNSFHTLETIHCYCESW